MQFFISHLLVTPNKTLKRNKIKVVYNVIDAILQLYYIFFYEVQKNYNATLPLKYGLP